MTALLDEKCQLTATGDGAWGRECDRTWWGHEAQHGGYVLGLALTALALELDDPAMGVQQCSLQYMRPFLDGPFRAEVTIERRGRTMANATARLWSRDKLSGLVLASFAVRRDVAPFDGARRPDVAPYDPDEEPVETGFGLPVFERMRLYPRLHEIDPGAPARVGGWVVPRTPEIVDHRYLGFLVDLWPPAAYHVWPEAVVAQSVDLTYHARSSLPRADLPPGAPLYVALTTEQSNGGFVDEDVEVWTTGGELLAVSRQMRYVHGEPRP